MSPIGKWIKVEVPLKINPNYLVWFFKCESVGEWKGQKYWSFEKEERVSETDKGLLRELDGFWMKDCRIVDESEVDFSRIYSK